MGHYHDVPVIEGYTRQQIISFIKLKLSFDNKWILKAFLRLWENQTDVEKENYISHGHNDLGFSKIDSLRMSVIYRNYQKEKQINKNDLIYLRKKIAKYAAQIATFADPVKLKKAMDDYFNYTNEKISNSNNYKFDTIVKEEKKPLIQMDKVV